MDGQLLASREREKFVACVRSGFGVPEQPKAADHVQGHVAEWVWYLLAEETGNDGRTLRALEPPSPHPTSPGGDGLGIYALDDETVVFRLWEIKKHVGSGSPSRAISVAYEQLKVHGTEYLAQYAGPGTKQPGEIGRVYGELVELWVDADPRAGVGVAVAVSEAAAPRRCFSRMHHRFPRLDQPGQLEGLVAGIGDFAVFADRVKGIVWSAL